MSNLKGLGVALVTPFNEDLSIDFDSLTKLVEYNIANGTDFLVVLGTTAETATLSKAEQAQVIEHIVKVNNKRLPLVLGIGGNNTLAVKEQIESTDLSDFEGVLSVSPYYNKPNQEGIYQHYKMLASTGKNIIIYNVPGRTGQNIDAATTLRLAKDFPNLFMIKEASPNISQYFDILRKKTAGFSLVSGDDEFTLPVTLAGGDGVISVIGQAYPKLFSDMIKLAKESKVKEAYAIHNQLVELIRLIFAEGNPCGVKTVLAEMGIIKNHLRLPLIKASENLQDRIKEFMLLKFLFFLPLFFITNGKCLAQEQQGQEVTEQEIKETQETLTIEPKQDSVNLIERLKFRPKELYIPTGLMALGLISEGKTKQEVHQWRNKQIPHFRNKFDDYLQFAPHVAVYGFELMGMKPKTDWKNRIAIHAKGHIITLGLAHLMKTLINNERPNGARMSFPSGHTAYAFSGATILAMEYKDEHPWVPYAAYGSAGVVGIMRIANNRHYVSDVLFGAGLGILSMKLAYWTHKYKWNKPKKEKKDPFLGVVY